MTHEIEIPYCSCGKIAQYRCSIDGEYVCCKCARFVLINKKHIKRFDQKDVMIKIYDKMKQDPIERSIFELLEVMTECPPPEQLDLDFTWSPSPGYIYGHPEYKVKTMAVYINKEQAGFLDFVFTVDAMEDMAIQFWEMAIHPKFQGIGVFTTMIQKLKEIAKENNVKKLYVTHENDNLPAIIAHFALGAKILYTLETKEEEKGRFTIPRKNELVLVYELGEENSDRIKEDLKDTFLAEKQIPSHN